MVSRLILASESQIRAKMLRDAGLEIDVVPARVDEIPVRDSLLAQKAAARDVADTLAEMKARKVSSKHPDALVLGCDQVLSFDNQLLSKPNDPEDACNQLRAMRGKTHQLLSAAVIYKSGQPLWRHVGVVRMSMRNFSDEYLDQYLERNWDSIQNSVGAYKLEEEGVRLFSRIEGDYFTVLGLPLLDLLNYLTLSGELQQ